MSGRRGLLSSSRRPVGSTAAASRPAAGPVRLPPYEPPSCPLDNTAKRALSEITHNRSTTKKYEDHLKQSVQLLTSSIYGVNDRRKYRNDDLEALVSRRHDKGSEDKSEQEKSVEKASGQLENDVPDLNLQIEAAIRAIIDGQAAFDDEKGVMSTMVDQVLLQPPRPLRRAPLPVPADEGETPRDNDEMETTEEEPPVIGAVELLQKYRDASAAQYDRLSAFQKYAESNQYRTFKDHWHSAYHDDDGVPLPDASTWFNSDGEPVISQDSRGARVDGDGDEDLVVEREVRSLKCPLTLRTMQDPYSSHKCKHTFEKDAIFEYLQRGPQRCPQTGCNQTLNKKDFFPDEAVLRRIKRAEQAERHNIGHTSDVEGDEEDGDASMMEAGSRNIKRDNARNRGRRVVEDIED